MTVTHIPMGLNPYEKQGTERVPYLPLNGDEVIVGIAIEGEIDPQLVILVNNKKTDVVKGTLVKQVDAKKYYDFEIGSFDKDDEVTYYIENEEEYSWTFGVSNIQSLDNIKTVSSNKSGVRLQADYSDIYVRFTDNSLVITGKDIDSADDWTFVDDDVYVYQDEKSGAKAQITKSPFSIDIIAPNGNIVARNLKFKLKQFRDRALEIVYTYETDCTAVYGLGERYNHVNHIGKKADCIVFDKFTNQGDATYYPVPMYHTDNGHGILIDTLCQTFYDFGSEKSGVFEIGVRADKQGSLPDIHVFFGTPKEIIKLYCDMTGMPKVPPKWTFGIWASANRWNCQKRVEEQLEYMEKYDYPTTVMVIEAWSDESTFYIWNDAEYTAVDGGENLSLSDFTFPQDGRWPDPKAMIEKLHEKGIKLVLWQIPVLREHEVFNTQHENDRQHAIKHNLCIIDSDGAPYQTPNPWFCESILPDFTNAQTRKWWFSKREYLLEMGVDGFKTDGGEVVFKDDVIVNSGATGREMKNGFASSYLEAYDEFIGEDRVLFSRAGYITSKSHPMHWGGDQMSTWSELRSVLKAGLSLGLTGVAYWTFDIAGFASVLPSAELYVRATQMAAFSPVVQWHSDLVNGQFNDLVPSAGGVNDRSPWNIAQFHGDDSIIDVSLKYSNMHMNLSPYLYQVAKNCAAEAKPMMRHLYYDYHDDERVRNIDDQYMMGDLLVAPIMHERETTREVYLPQGTWINIFTGEEFEGTKTIKVQAEIGEIPVFINCGSAMALNLNNSFQFGGSVGNAMDRYINLCIYISGDSGEYSFNDNGVEIELSFIDGAIESKNNKEYYVISKNKLDKMEHCDIIEFGNYNTYLYRIGK